MTTSRKTILIGFGIAMAVFIALVIYPLFSGIQRESNNFIFQMEELAELEKKIQNLNDFQASYKEYQANFKKIEELFINSSEPVNFIEFLEGEARNADLDIKILPFAPEKEGKPWPSMNFRLSTRGAFPGFLKFIERLESSSYLVDILNLNAVRGENESETEITLLIKVYTK